MKKEYIIPIFVPHLGCPNDCTFCNQKAISGQTKMVTAKDVTETIESFLQYMKDANADKEVLFMEEVLQQSQKKNKKNCYKQPIPIYKRE